MKATIFLVLFLISVKCFGQSLKNYTSYNDSVLATFIENSKIDTSLTIYFCKYSFDKDLIMFANDANSAYASTNKHNDGKTYTINIKEGFNYKMLRRILYHELAHVKQYSSGKLRVLKTVVIYDNKPYTSNDLNEIGYTHYPWEKDAQIEMRKMISIHH